MVGEVVAYRIEALSSRSDESFEERDKITYGSRYKTHLTRDEIADNAAGSPNVKDHPRSNIKDCEMATKKVACLFHPAFESAKSDASPKNTKKSCYNPVTASDEHGGIMGTTITNDPSEKSAGDPDHDEDEVKFEELTERSDLRIRKTMGNFDTDDTEDVSDTVSKSEERDIPSGSAPDVSGLALDDGNKFPETEIVGSATKAPSAKNY